MECIVCEAMCPDAVDGTLTEADRRVFDHHVAQCPSCARELEDAQRGAAWLGMLKGHTPEPPAALLAKILAETTGIEDAAPHAAAAPVSQAPAEPVPDASFVSPSIPAPEPVPAWALSSVLRKVGDVFRIETARATFQPRLAMTAAMAFVSIALTLNLAGVRLKNLRASDFTPSGLKRDVADATASVARNFQNMRVVYQVESRVSELRGEGPLAQPVDATFNPDATAPQQPQPQAAPASRKKGL
ncbi:MAG TPA: zf-HC2 domain-containing protein [Candidatus Aquilonibacter sp.]|nr:zf-HC2 domain-containing protein [Candidatus Aquilonibacter sp.]